MKEILSVCRHRCRWWRYPWWWRRWWWWWWWCWWWWYKAQLTITWSILSLSDGNHQCMKILSRKLSALNLKAWTLLSRPTGQQFSCRCAISLGVPGVPIHYFTNSLAPAFKTLLQTPTLSTTSNLLMLGFYVTDAMIVASLINWIFPSSWVFAKCSNQRRHQSPITITNHQITIWAERWLRNRSNWRCLGASLALGGSTAGVEPQLLQLPAGCLYKPAWLAEPCLPLCKP